MIALWLWAFDDAVAGKTTKIEKSLAASGSGDADAWVDARERVDKALAKAPEDPELLALAGRIWLAAASGGAAADADPFARAVDAFERAQRAGLEGEPRSLAEPAVAQLASSLVSSLTNDVEGKQWEDARAREALASRAFAVAEALGQRDPDRVAVYEKLAARVAIQAKDAAGMRSHYERLFAATQVHDAALAGKIARKLAELGAPADALLFLGPILDAAPTDEALLRAWVELSLAAQQPDGAIGRLDAVNATLVTSKSGAVLLGELYEVCGQRDQARAAYEALLAAEPTNIPANLSLARFWLAAAQATSAQLDAETAARKPTRELAKLTASAAADLAAADARATAATDADGSQVASWQLLVQILEARKARLPAPPKTPADKALLKELDQRTAVAQGKLAALQATP